MTAENCQGHDTAHEERYLASPAEIEHTARVVAQITVAASVLDGGRSVGLSVAVHARVSAAFDIDSHSGRCGNHFLYKIKAKLSNVMRCQILTRWICSLDKSSSCFRSFARPPRTSCPSIGSTVRPHAQSQSSPTLNHDKYKLSILSQACKFFFGGLTKNKEHRIRYVVHFSFRRYFYFFSELSLNLNDLPRY